MFPRQRSFSIFASILESESIHFAIPYAVLVYRSNVAMVFSRRSPVAFSAKDLEVEYTNLLKRRVFRMMQFEIFKSSAFFANNIAASVNHGHKDIFLHARRDII